MDTLRALRVLGLPPSATADDIKNAWRDLAKVWHPDRFVHDERLQQKAGDNLKRINEAHETLRNYDPAKSPKLASRVRESVAMILGMGELGDPPPVPSTPASTARPERPFTPSAPIGVRHSLRVLGIGTQRTAGEPGTRHRSSNRRWRVATVAFVILVAAAIVSLLR